jgi:hypothetical protein
VTLGAVPMDDGREQTYQISAATRDPNTVPHAHVYSQASPGAVFEVYANDLVMVDPFTGMRLRVHNVFCADKTMTFHQAARRVLDVAEAIGFTGNYPGRFAK